MKAWPVIAIAAMQFLLLAAHIFLLRTAILFLPPLSASTVRWTTVGLIALSFSFISAAMIGFHYAGLWIRVYYRLAAIWLGFLNYFFWSACLCRLTIFAISHTAWAARLPEWRALIGSLYFALAVAVTLLGMANTRWIRVRRLTVKLDRLPEAWRGRRILMLSDLHLGNVNYLGYSQRAANLARRLEPEILLIAGDLFDGAQTDPELLLRPWQSVRPPLGVYFAAGNHDEIGGPDHYTAALRNAGIHVLKNERVRIDGLQLVGVAYSLANDPLRMKVLLEGMNLKQDGAAILLNHEPNRLSIAESAGVGLQLSGHTHGGQLFPFTLIVKWAFGRFQHGLHEFGALQVYTSTGCGAWGPPMRVGTVPEAVVLQLEPANPQ